METLKMKKKDDLRVVRTIFILKKSLFDLLKLMPYEKISVMNICDNADIHRTTFYKHFEDKKHLLMCALEDVKEEVFADLSQKYSFETPKAMFMYLGRSAFEFFSKRKESAQAIYKNLNNDDVYFLAMDALERSVKYLLLQNTDFKKYKIPLNVMSSFFTGGLVNLIVRWLNSGFKYTEDEMLCFIDDLLEEESYR